VRDNTGPLLELENLDKGCLAPEARRIIQRLESKFALLEKIVEKNVDARTGREGDLRLGIRLAVIVLELQRKQLALDRGIIGCPQNVP
jgi:hypothetical protein